MIETILTFPKETLCLGSDSAAGADISACAAINTNVGINYIVLTLGDSSHRALFFTCTACNAVVGNFVSHKTIYNLVIYNFFIYFSIWSFDYLSLFTYHFLPRRAARSFWFGVVAAPSAKPCCLANVVQFFAPLAVLTGRPNCKKWQ